MTEFHTRKAIDNSRLARPVAPHGLRQLLGLVALCALLAGVAMLYAWQHFAYIQMRYQFETLKSQRTQAVELNQNLKLEEAGLRAPARISDIARRQLGLTAPAPAQVAPFEGAGEPVFAEMRPEMRATAATGAQ
jgi:cell division protein FtsL